MKIAVIILLVGLCSCTQAPPPQAQQQTAQKKPQKQDDGIQISHKEWAP